MEITAKTDDPMEAKRIVKSLDMASLLFEIQYNLFRHFEDSDCDYEPVFAKLYEMFEEHDINVDELIA